MKEFCGFFCRAMTAINAEQILRFNHNNHNNHNKFCERDSRVKNKEINKGLHSDVLFMKTLNKFQISFFHLPQFVVQRQSAKFVQCLFFNHSSVAFKWI